MGCESSHWHRHKHTHVHNSFPLHLKWKGVVVGFFLTMAVRRITRWHFLSITLMDYKFKGQSFFPVIAHQSGKERLGGKSEDWFEKCNPMLYSCQVRVNKPWWLKEEMHTQHSRLWSRLAKLPCLAKFKTTHSTCCTCFFITKLRMTSTGFPAENVLV